MNQAPFKYLIIKARRLDRAGKKEGAE